MSEFLCGASILLFCAHISCVLTLELNFPFTESFKIKVLSVGKCSIPRERYDSAVIVPFNIWARKITREKVVLNANLTVPKLVGPISMSVKSYKLQQNSVKDLLFKIEGLKCNHVLPSHFIKLANVSVANNCTVLPGNYRLNGVNLDDYSSIMSVSLVQPGRYSYDVEVASSKGLLICSSIVCDMSVQNKRTHG